MDVRLGGRLVVVDTLEEFLELDGLGARGCGGNAAVALLLAFSLACGGDGNEPRAPTGPTPTTNRAPVRLGSIPAQSVPQVRAFTRSWRSTSATRTMTR